MEPLLELLGGRVATAARAAFGPEVSLGDQLVLPTRDPKHGDYSTPVAMSLAKQLGRPPMGLAAELAAALDVAELSEAPEVVPPGFVNLRLRPDWLASRLDALNGEGRLGVSVAPSPGTAVLDYSGPNMAKQMHVGHLRSTIIGDCLANVLEVAGDQVQRVNHIGDWGAQFGMLLAHLEDVRSGGDLGIADVEVFYREANARDKEDEAFHELARRRVVELQTGEASALAAWSELIGLTRRTNDAVYDLLGIRDLEERGESFYQPMLADVVAELESLGLCVEDQGAKVVFVDGFTNKEGDPLPLIVQNRHGGYGYATTDLAAIRHRVRELGASRIVYVVDAGQSQHLQMVFAAARAAGWIPDGVRVEHVAFGLVLGEDGKRLRTRTGDNVRLGDLVGEAVERARAFVVARAEEREQALPDDLDEVARVIGVGAVKYADLSQNRQTNYAFSFDRMLSLKGNTAPYLQYAYARMRSILRDVGDRPADVVPVLTDPAELALAKLLVGTPDVVVRVVEDLEPNHLCAHLFEVAQAFSTFYEACPVLRAEEPARSSRLLLCEVSSSVLREGLGLLGIDVLERL